MKGVRGHSEPLRVDSVVLPTFIVGALAFVSVIYVLVLGNADALKSLIEAEANIIGLFGIVAVCWLASLDSRIEPARARAGLRKIE
jgi:hypothetical protein